MMLTLNVVVLRTFKIIDHLQSNLLHSSLISPCRSIPVTTTPNYIASSSVGGTTSIYSTSTPIITPVSIISRRSSIITTASPTTRSSSSSTTLFLRILCRQIRRSTKRTMVIIHKPHNHTVKMECMMTVFIHWPTNFITNFVSLPTNRTIFSTI